ncbi:uncharacterized protein TNCV_4834341 [Trichonephila clavipes]|nr:uncharacterized protein TNCV_4834341 [Trichonephila clavipes]
MSSQSTLRYNSDVRASVILLGNSPVNAVRDWQFYRLNYQTDAQICNQYVWDNNENYPAVIGNFSPEHDFRCRPSVSRHHWQQGRTCFRQNIRREIRQRRRRIHQQITELEVTDC